MLAKEGGGQEKYCTILNKQRNVIIYSLNIKDLFQYVVRNPILQEERVQMVILE